jgi:glycosyltransferase involved in cell wall biosynthesis
MEQPLVTVITVTYNAARYVRDAIESVLAQDYSNIEYIIGDDCSTDETWQIVSGYRDPRIRAYRNETNLREYPNRNKAIGLATGKYLIFIDGDDIIFPHGIGFFVQMMEAFPEAGMAIQKNYYNNILYPALFSPEQTLRNHFYGKFDLLTSSFASDFFRTSPLQEWKLSTKYISGDEEIRLKFAMHYPVLFVAGWVSWPRETPGQASSKITAGRGLVERYQYATETLSVQNKNVEPALLEDMQAVIKKNIAKYILHFLARGKFDTIKEILSETGFTWKEIMKYSRHKPAYHDILEEYSASNPFKNGFLNKERPC